MKEQIVLVGLVGTVRRYGRLRIRYQWSSIKLTLKCVSASIKFQIYCTGKEDEDLDSFSILLPAVSVLAVHWVTRVLSCVCTSGVNQCQNAISLMLYNPAKTKDATKAQLQQIIIIIHYV